LTYLTLDDPPGSVSFSAGSASGFVNPFTGPLDSVDAICLGACSLASEDLIAFTLSVSAGAVFEIGVSALGAGNALSLGYFSAPGGAPTSLSLAVPTVPLFTFLGGLTGTSRVLFVAYAAGTLPANPNPPFPFPVGHTNFMIAEDGGAGLQTVSAIVTPEPGTILLLGGGFVLLGAHRRRSVSRRPSLDRLQTILFFESLGKGDVFGDPRG